MAKPFCFGSFQAEGSNDICRSCSFSKECLQEKERTTLRKDADDLLAKFTREELEAEIKRREREDKIKLVAEAEEKIQQVYSLFNWLRENGFDVEAMDMDHEWHSVKDIHYLEVKLNDDTM